MIRRLTATDAAVRMPPGDASLTAAQIDTLRKWVEAGAAWPKEGTAPAPATRTELTVTDDDRRHWAFRPLAKVEQPAVVGLDPQRSITAPAGSRRCADSAGPRIQVLIRRVTFDPIGLPRPDEVEAFVKAADPTPPTSARGPPPHQPQYGALGKAPARRRPVRRQQGTSRRRSADRLSLRDFVIVA
jgi:hypothetical protein